MRILEPHQNININFESVIVKLSEKRDLVAISIWVEPWWGFFGVGEDVEIKLVYYVIKFSDIYPTNVCYCMIYL